MTRTTIDKYNGECLCGAVSFCFEPPTLWCAHCHCTMCQRAHGAAFVTWVGAAEQRFEVADDTQLRWYASSAEAERGFCIRCGSTLFFRSQRWPGEVHIALSNVRGEIDRKPDLHVSWDTHVPWVELTDQLPRRALNTEPAE